MIDNKFIEDIYFADQYGFVDTCNRFDIQLPDNWNEILLNKKRPLIIGESTIQYEWNDGFPSIYIKRPDSVAVFFISYDETKIN